MHRIIIEEKRCWPLLGLMAIAFLLTFTLKWGMARMLTVCAALGVGLTLVV